MFGHTLKMFGHTLKMFGHTLKFQQMSHLLMSFIAAAVSNFHSDAFWFHGNILQCYQMQAYVKQKPMAKKKHTFSCSFFVHHIFDYKSHL